MFIPTYLDEDAEVRTYLSGMINHHRHGGTASPTSRGTPARSEAADSAATTSMMQRRQRGPRSTMSAASGAGSALSGRAPRILDAAGRPGVGGGVRGGRRRAARRGIGRAETMARAIDAEERSELSRSSAGWMQRERILAENAARSEIQSSMSGMQDQRGGGAGERNKRGVSGAASSVLSADEEAQGPGTVVSAGMRSSASMSGLGAHRRKFGGSVSNVSGQARSVMSSTARSEAPSMWALAEKSFVDDISPNDAADANDPGQIKPYRDDDEAELTLCCGPTALWRARTLRYGLDYVIELAEPDAETRRLVHLGIPMTISCVMESAFEAITIAVISQYLGTNEIAAYVTVHLVLGMTDELFNGLIAAESTVCSHAIGHGNNFLAGQYVQIGVFVYIVFSIPAMAMWAFVMGDLLKFLGFSDVIARIGVEYTRVVVFHYLMEGVAESYCVLLDITGHETFGMFVDLAEGVADVGVVWVMLEYVPGIDLVTVGFMHLVIAVVFFIFMLGAALCKGWLADYWSGMLGSFALTVSRFPIH